MGAEGASPQRVKAALARMIQGEDPRRPLSDQALGERLQAAGLPLARRTVAKYRREMGLPRPIAGGGEEEAQKEPSQTMAGLLF